MAGKLKNDYTGWIMKEHGVPDSRLTVLYRAPNDQRNKVMWHCRCECGNELDVRSDSLSGNTKSCGCLSKENIAKISREYCTKNITGQRYGNLIALHSTEKKGPRPGVYWLCQCDCGNTTEAIVADLTCGKVTSCGCSRLPKDSLVGKIFGRLTVLEYAGTAGGGNGALYKCLCTCGKYVITRADSLRQGATQSCGCLQKERAHESYRDISGERFGFLTALYPIGTQGKKSMVWHCKCDCGNEKDIALTYLRSGESRSCGCQKSLGEAEINRILSQTNLKYIHDKNYFNDLYSQNHIKLRYDFIIFDENDNPIRLIEFDGIQHFKPIEHFDGEEGFLERQKLDRIKNEYAFSHNIPLVRIPYTERDNITLEMIMDDQYLVRPIEENKNV